MTRGTAEQKTAEMGKAQRGVGGSKLPVVLGRTVRRWPISNAPGVRTLLRPGTTALRGCRAPPAPPRCFPTPAVNAQLEKQIKAVPTGVDLANLNQNLELFVAQKKRLPTSLAELSPDSGCPIPKLPDGVVLVIDQKSSRIKAVKTP